MIYDSDPKIQEALNELVMVLHLQQSKNSEEIKYLRSVLQRVYRAGVAYALESELPAP